MFKFKLTSIFGLTVLCCIFSVTTGKAQNTKRNHFTKNDYTKHQYDIKMRDGVKLHTVVYRPKDTSQTYPILMERTPYSCRPYGKNVMPKRIMSNPYMVQDGYIFVCQDVRGRWLSGGDISTVTPNVPGPKGIDESSDAYDTIKWLVKNIPDNNGKVGQYGISYPGFYTLAAMPNAPKALDASSPQAPVTDFFFDDYHHKGAFVMDYWYNFNLFGTRRPAPTDTAWYHLPNIHTRDAYWFYLHKMEPFSNSKKYYKNDFFYHQLINHPNYDKFWQKRDILPWLKNIHHPVLVVGGLNDAEDLYGALHAYKAIEKQNPGIHNTLVEGPWSHGQWSEPNGPIVVGNIYYGSNINRFFKKNIEAPFFRANLEGEGKADLPEALVYDTGLRKWDRFNHWPPKNAKRTSWYVHANGSFNRKKPKNKEKKYSQYVSDLSHPVPMESIPRIRFTPRPYMTSDQRFAARRPDVLTFDTQTLKKNVTITGPISAKLFVSTSGTASDWIVKLIDVFPPNMGERETALVDSLKAYKPKNVLLDNYHELIRTGVIRGRFRTGFDNPEPFKPNKITKVDVPLQAVNHTFKKGHKIEIQIQSTDFPLFDLNPQKYVKNIFKADSSDFQNATQRIYHTPGHPSIIEMGILKGQAH